MGIQINDFMVDIGCPGNADINETLRTESTMTCSIKNEGDTVESVIVSLKIEDTDSHYSSQQQVIVIQPNGDAPIRIDLGLDADYISIGQKEVTATATVGDESSSTSCTFTVSDYEMLERDISGVSMDINSFIDKSKSNFLDDLLPPNRPTVFSVNAMVRIINDDSISISPTRLCLSWIDIPKDIIKSISYLGKRKCGNSEHDYAKIEFTVPIDLNNPTINAFAGLANALASERN